MSRCYICNYANGIDGKRVVKYNKKIGKDVCVECYTAGREALEEMGQEEYTMECTIVKGNATHRGQLFSVVFCNERIVESSIDPEHDACRALLKMGLTGKVAFKHNGSKIVSSIKDIEKDSKYTMQEGSRYPLRKVRYTEWVAPKSATNDSQVAEVPSNQTAAGEKNANSSTLS